LQKLVQGLATSALKSVAEKAGKLSFWSCINQVMFKASLLIRDLFLTLSLLMTWLRANYPDYTVSLDNFAFAANALH
jgi:hypothetical protein